MIGSLWVQKVRTNENCIGSANASGAIKSTDSRVPGQLYEQNHK
jgi:hypothetical protein